MKKQRSFLIPLAVLAGALLSSTALAIVQPNQAIQPATVSVAASEGNLSANQNLFKFVLKASEQNLQVAGHYSHSSHASHSSHRSHYSGR